jgi:phage terminase large subunit GpA
MKNEDLIASTPLAWITLNEMVNENQELIEFDNHRFLIDFYADEADDIVSRKSAQVGFSVAAILKSFHSARYGGWNIIYALPTNNVVNDFVKPKVNPLISSNKSIASIVHDDSVSLKRVGDRFVFFKGGFSDREAISISGDILVIDEYDRMPDMNVVNTFDSRLQASKSPKRWRFSNPSQVGFGVDGLFTDSNQLHWFVKCGHCGYEWFMDWTKEDGTHYVDRERKIYVCGKCDKEITDEYRRMGRWVAKYPNRKRHGYWFSQMMAPWVSAARIIEQFEESNVEFFHNFVLGKAYTPTDMIVDRAAILRATAPSNIPKTQVAIGVDQDAGGQYFVAMTPQGIFAHGYVDSWEKIEQLKLMYNAIVVCDPNPYQAMPKQMANKYSDWYLCYFKTLDGLSAIQWKEKEQIVYADRTRVIDIRANEIVQARLLYRERPHEIEDIIAHWGNLYRTTEEKDDGRVRSIWIKKDDKQSDYPFAEVYARIGLSQVLGGNSEFIEPSMQPDSPITNISTVDGKNLNVDFRQILQDTWDAQDE